MENEWTKEIDRLNSVVAAQTVALDGRQAMINSLVRDTVELKEAGRRLLLAVLVDQTRSRLMPAIDMAGEIEAMRIALEGGN